MLKKKLLPGVTSFANLIIGVFLFIVSPTLTFADSSVLISNEKISVTGPQTVSVTWTTNVPTTGRVVYGPVAQAILTGAGISPQYGYASTTAEVTIKNTTHNIVIGPIMGGMTYFRPISSDGTSTTIGNEVNINTSSLNGSCSYITTYLKRGAINDINEVKKLQAFLRGVEKDTTVAVNGVFDDATYNSILKFQSKYKNDILTPWGVSSPTGYVYITTKRKINEIFCSTNIALTNEEEMIIRGVRSGSTPGVEIGKGIISTDGSLAWGNGATGTGTSTLGAVDDIGSVVGGTGVVQGKLSAFLAGAKDFFSHNQLFMLFLFIVAFAVIYLMRNKGTETKQLLKEK